VQVSIRIHNSWYNDYFQLVALLALIAGGASEAIRATIGPTKVNLETFLRRNLAIFDLPVDAAESVDLVKNAKLSVIITSSRPTSSPINPSDLLRPAQGGTGANSGGDASRPAPIVHQGKVFNFIADRNNN